MSLRLLKILSLCSVSIVLLACTSTSSIPTAITAPLEISEWETRLPNKQGAVKITFILPQHAWAEFQLFDGKPSNINSALARLILNDQNCTSGHLGSISYNHSESEYLIRYFEKEADWNQTNTIILRWNTNKQITATLNNEAISIDAYDHVNRLKIISKTSPIKIQTLEYLPL